MKKEYLKYKKFYRKMQVIYWFGITFELFMSYVYNIYSPSIILGLIHGGFLAFYITMLVRLHKEHKPLLKALKGFYHITEEMKKQLDKEI